MLCSLKNSETLLSNVSLHTTTQKIVFHMSLLSQPQISLKFLEHIPLLNDNICNYSLSSVESIVLDGPLSSWSSIGLMSPKYPII